MMQMATNGRKTYYSHLNGLKGVACILVMVGHYLGLYKYAQSFSPSLYIIDIVNNSSFSFLIDEGYWLFLFFVVSGYLVSKSKITSMAELISKVISRFIRLALPILFSYFVIYLIYLAFGFHTVETYNLFQNQWYQNYYISAYSIKDVLLGPIYVLLLGKSILNGPYWVLQMMFISSVLIYILELVLFKLNAPEHEAFSFSMLIIIVIGSAFVSLIIAACLIGALVSFYETSEDKRNTCYALWFLILSSLIYIWPERLQATFFLQL